MSEYIIYWGGIGSQLTDMLSEHVPPYLWPKRIRQERLREKIVRCRDCKHFKAETRRYPASCRLWLPRNLSKQYGIEPDGFCAWGERREP